MKIVTWFQFLKGSHLAIHIRRVMDEVVCYLVFASKESIPAVGEGGIVEGSRNEIRLGVS